MPHLVELFLWLTFTLRHNSQVQDSVFRVDKTSGSFLPEVFLLVQLIRRLERTGNAKAISHCVFFSAIAVVGRCNSILKISLRVDYFVRNA